MGSDKGHNEPFFLFVGGFILTKEPCGVVFQFQIIPHSTLLVFELFFAEG
jgi:hypothetical protein